MNGELSLQEAMVMSQDRRRHDAILSHFESSDPLIASN